MLGAIFGLNIASVKKLTFQGRPMYFLRVLKSEPISAVTSVTVVTRKCFVEYQRVMRDAKVTPCYKTGQMLQNLRENRVESQKTIS